MDTRLPRCPAAAARHTGAGGSCRGPRPATSNGAAAPCGSSAPLPAPFNGGATRPSSSAAPRPSAPPSSSRHASALSLARRLPSAVRLKPQKETPSRGRPQLLHGHSV